MDVIDFNLNDEELSPLDAECELSGETVVGCLMRMKVQN